MKPVWLKLFQAAFFIGFGGGGLCYYVVCLISPPPGRPYAKELFGNEHETVIEGVIKINGDFDTPIEAKKEDAVTIAKVV